jgi:hypothetical protein
MKSKFAIGDQVSTRLQMPKHTGIVKNIVTREQYKFNLIYIKVDNKKDLLWFYEWELEKEEEIA